MKTKMTMTDKLLSAALFVSIGATVLHASIPTFVCTIVHVAVTLLVSGVHVLKNKEKAALALAP